MAVSSVSRHIGFRQHQFRGLRKYDSIFQCVNFPTASSEYNILWPGWRSRTVNGSVFSSVKVTEAATPPTVAVTLESKPLPLTTIWVQVTHSLAEVTDGERRRTKVNHREPFVSQEVHMTAPGINR